MTPFESFNENDFGRKHAKIQEPYSGEVFVDPPRRGPAEGPILPYYWSLSVFVENAFNKHAKIKEPSNMAVAACQTDAVPETTKIQRPLVVSLRF